MVLTIDIGNTTIGIGAFSGDTLCICEKLSSTAPATETDYIYRLEHIWQAHGFYVHDIEGSIISSVVPGLTDTFRSALTRWTQKPVLLLTHKIKLPLEMDVDAPEKVGCDRIADAVGAASLYPLPLITIDMGTATTFNVVDSQRHFQGGIIMPGVGTAGKALLGNTALLSDEATKLPAHTIGRNTQECISCGRVYGNACAIDGLITRIQAELGCSCTIIATGGYAESIIPHCQTDIIIDTTLLLKGLKALYYLNK